MDEIVLFGKILSDPTRLRILAVLQHEDLCVCEIGDALEITQSTLSNHLQLIKQAQLVTTRKNKKWIYYTISPRQKATLDAVFTHYQHILTSDARLLRDRQRVQERLRLRVDNCCVMSNTLAEIGAKGGEIK